MLRRLRRAPDGAAAPDRSAVPAAGRVFDPRDPDFVRDPYPLLSWLRDHDPVHRSPAGPWVLSRYADVHAALADDPKMSNVASPRVQGAGSKTP